LRVRGWGVCAARCASIALVPFEVLDGEAFWYKKFGRATSAVNTVGAKWNRQVDRPRDNCAPRFQVASSRKGGRRTSEVLV